VRLANLAPVGEVEPAHARVGAEWHEGRPRGKFGTCVAIELRVCIESGVGRREHDDRAAFRRFIGERGEVRGFVRARFVNPGRDDDFARLTVAERDRAGLVE